MVTLQKHVNGNFHSRRWGLSGGFRLYERKFLTDNMYPHYQLKKQAGLRFSVQLGQTLTPSIKLNDEG